MLNQLLPDEFYGFAAGLADQVTSQLERANLLDTLFPIVRDGAGLGVQAAAAQLDSIGIGVDWTLVNHAAQTWAAEHAGELVKGLTDTTRAAVQDGIAHWIESGAPYAELKKALEPHFGKERADLIASTEVTRAYAEGNRAAWKESGVIQTVAWAVANDEAMCPICSDLDGQEFELESLEVSPPAHPRCRCWWSPVVKEN